ncbi:Bug family tripartite tricarboxylate transporter substrate binding protein [Falsiroseomonas ponticola]|uniref:Bug family tripartite tricarboxylate transporter substrate binding protein n=1 Tax=Falsiroseomonas ponticola TaxID=2786951 RepID=UPI0019340F25|nr:tripartite tricarboxylate transporter substrate binding protein [Roseomonas ponticola]
MTFPIALTRRRWLALGAATLAQPAIVKAQPAWPDRPVTLVVPFGAGGGNDITARTLGQFLERELGQPFVVQNRPGAGGEIGINAVADSRPDGHTFGILNTPGLVTIPIERNPRWNLDSFSFVASLVDDPAIIGVHAQSGIASLADLVAAARREPEMITIATQARGSTSFLSVRMLEMAAGISLTPVIYNALPPGVLAVTQREVRGAAANLGEAMIMTASQPFRMLGVMAEERSTLDPTLPTFREQGVDVAIGSLRGFVGPRGIPAPILARLTAAIDKVSRDPDYLEACRRTQQPLRIMLGDAYVAHLRDADTRFRALWQQKPWI